jgi:hypothetical protein
MRGNGWSDAAIVPQASGDWVAPGKPKIHHEATKDTKRSKNARFDGTVNHRFGGFAGTDARASF